MEKKHKKGSWSVLLGLFLMAAIGISGCSGGGGGGGGTATTEEPTSGGSGAALQVAERISVVDAQSGSGSGVSPLRIGKFRVTQPTFANNTSTDWYKDQTQIFVHERSAESFDIINEILCMMGQSKYDEMVNKGSYRAQVDMNQCSQDRDSAKSAGQSSQNQSSGSTMPDYENWTVNSYRADNSSQHIVKVWIHEEAGEFEPAKTIYVKITITEGKSETNPYGIFVMNFKATPEGASTTMFKGYLKSERDSATGKVLLKFAMEGGFDGTSFSEKVVLDRQQAADGSISGTGTIAVNDSWGGETKTMSFNIAFSPDYFLRESGSDQKCLDRKNYNETAWRYGLYYAADTVEDGVTHTAGSRVNRNSGFPIKYNGYHGWVGYWGLWLPEEASISDGAPVYRQEYSSNAPPTKTAYTLMKRGGKLKKHTRNQLTLNAIQNIPLDWWECSGTGPCTGYRAKWTDQKNGVTDGNYEFVKFAKQNSTTYMWEDLTTEEALNLSTLQWGELNFWSQSLGGQVRIKLNVSGDWPNVTYSYPGASTAGTVIFYKEDVVFPGDSVPANLRCYDNCPVYNATTGVAGSGWGTDPNNPTAYNYTFDSSVSGMLLKDASNNSLVLSSASGENQWGFMSGPLFDPSTSNMALLDCNWDGDNNPSTNQQTCGWKAWSELSEYYSWETGPNQWNQFTAILNPTTNAPERFQAPLQVLYEYQDGDSSVATAADNKYCLDGAATCANGTNFYLEYSGFGELHGIPGTCVNMDDGLPASCGPNTRWIAEFMIPTGATATDGSSVSYYIKPLEIEQTMSLKADTSACTAAGLITTTYTLPSISDWSDPNIGTEPTGSSLISEAPAVIGGVVQPGF